MGTCLIARHRATSQNRVSLHGDAFRLVRFGGRKMVRDFLNLKSRGSIGRTQAVSIPSALRCSQSPGDQKAESFVRTVHKADGLEIPTLKSNDGQILTKNHLRVVISNTQHESFKICKKTWISCFWKL